MRRPIRAGNPFGVSYRSYLWEVLKDRPQPGYHLDYGAHDGAVIAKLQQTGVIVGGVGLDLSSDTVACHRDRMPEGVQLEAIRKGEALRFPDATFDTISMLGVLEHIYDQKHILSELHRVLKPDGLFVVVVPGKYLLSFLDIGNWKFVFPKLHRLAYSTVLSAAAYKARYLDCPDGLVGDIEVEKSWHQHFTRSELRALLRDAQFVTVDEDGFAYLYRPLILFDLITRNALRAITGPLARWDGRHFHSGELLFTARKSGAHG